MKNSESTKLFTAVPVQVMNYGEDIILKRGITQVQISGEGSYNVVKTILYNFMEQPLSLPDLYALFALPDRESIAELTDHLISHKIIVPYGEANNLIENEKPEDIYYWHFNSKKSLVQANINKAELILCGVNTISYKLWTAFRDQGLGQLKVIDSPMLRNMLYFDKVGNVVKEKWPELIDIITSEDTWKKLDSYTSNCLIGTSEFGGQALLLDWNFWCVTKRIDFYPIYLQDMVGNIGPWVVPGESACLYCLRARQNSNFALPSEIRHVESNYDAKQCLEAFHPSMLDILADVAVFELTNFYGKLNRGKIGKWLEINLVQSSMEKHHVLKVPRCPVCSSLNKANYNDYKIIMPLPDQDCASKLEN